MHSPTSVEQVQVFFVFVISMAQYSLTVQICGAWPETPIISFHFHLQLRVAVYDSAKPDKRTITTVTIPVLRNVNTPKFQQENYEETINENAPVGRSILTVRAVDEDNVSGFNIL